MEKNAFVSIIIPTYNRKELLGKAVISLLNQSYPKNSYEIIVVDDGSTDGTEELIRVLEKENPLSLKYIYQKNRGPAVARNLGIKSAHGEVVAFCDSDCVASNNWLEEIIKGYGNDEIAGIGGTIRAIPTDSIVSQYCGYIRMNEKPGVLEKTGTTYLITGNASFRKNCLVSVGGFDKRYNLPGGEDPDICYRLERKGYKLTYNPNAIVFNPHKQTLFEFAKTYFNYGKGDSFLTLRRLSKWDLTGKAGAKWLFYLFKAMAKMSVMFISNFSLIRPLLKIPFKVLSYYGKEGLGVKESTAYAFLDFIKIFSFIQGCFFGYIIGKFKGFKVSEDINYIL